MRMLLVSSVWSIAFASVCAAQIASFSPCRVAEPFTVGHKDGITIQRVAVVEPAGETSATVLIPGSDAPVPAIVFSHSEILGQNEKADLRQFAWALARAGAASIVLDGTIDWQSPNDDFGRPPHLMACAAQWLLLHAKVDRRRLARAGPAGHWGGGDTPFCLPGEEPCWHPALWLNFGQTSPAECHNTERMLKPEGQLSLAQFAQSHLRLKEVRPEWFLSAPADLLNNGAPPASTAIQIPVAEPRQD